MEISVRADTQKLKRDLNLIQRQQVPFATALALTNTAWDVAKAETKQTRRDLDRPTPFTQKGFRVRKANKRNQTAIIYIAPIQDKYLSTQIKGGRRTPKGRAIPVPARAMNLNAYGNMTRRKISNMLAKPHLYKSMEINGTAGIWKLYKKRPPKLMVLWAKSAQYKKRFRFYETGAKTIRRVYRRRFNVALAKAMKTAY